MLQHFLARNWVFGYDFFASYNEVLNMSVMFIVQSSLSVPDSLREGASIVFCKRINDKKESRVLKILVDRLGSQFTVLDGADG